MNSDSLILQEALRLQHIGLALVPCKPGSKEPAAGTGWNKRESLIRTPEQVRAYFEQRNCNIGIHLAENGLVSLDPDMLKLTRHIFEEIGLDFEALMNSGWRIEGKPGRGRTVYKARDGMAVSHKTFTVPARVARQFGEPVKEGTLDDTSVVVFELRGGSANLQDIVPPSVHPETKARYRSLNGDPASRDDIGELPQQLVDMWTNWPDYVAKFCNVLGLDAQATRSRPTKRSALVPGKQRVAHDPNSVVGIGETWSATMNHDFATLLKDHGYTQLHAGHWVSPHSQSGNAGVHIMEDGKHVNCFHQGDPLCETYDDAKGGGQRPQSLFDVMRILECNGDYATAVRRAERDLSSADDDFGGLDDAAPRAAFTRGHKPLRTLTLAQLEALPPVEWLIDSLLPRGGLAMLFGASGVGKSFVALDMALAVARGVSWQDHPVKQGGVLYVAGEGSSGFGGRVAAYRKHRGADLSDASFLFVPEGVNFLGDIDVQRVIDACRSMQMPARLVVVDTLNRAMPGGKENSPEDMGKAISATAKITESTGATVMLIHHAGKDQERGARGHSSLRAAVDTELEVTANGDLRFIEVTKQRDGQDQLRLAFRLVNVEISNDPQTGAVMVPVVEEVPVGANHAAPKGKWQILVLFAIEKARFDAFAGDDRGVDLETILTFVAAAFQKTNAGPLPDRFREAVTRALDSLMKQRLVVRDGDHYRERDPLN